MKHTPHLHLPGEWTGSTLPASDSQRNHLSRVLRLEKGSAVTYTNGAGLWGEGTWSGDAVERGDESARHRPSSLVLAVAPPSNKDRTRFLVEKLAELGVESLIWLKTAWGEGRVPSAEKQSAWAIGALEQSRGAWLMQTGAGLVGFDGLEGPVVVCSPHGGELRPEITARTVVVGPEGGLSPTEIPDGLEQVRIAETILRIETAAMAAAIIFR